MPENRCPLCDSPCIVKIVSAGDERYRKVDVCSTCGAKFPGGGAPSATGGRKPKAKASKK